MKSRFKICCIATKLNSQSLNQTVWTVWSKGEPTDTEKSLDRSAGRQCTVQFYENSFEVRIIIQYIEIFGGWRIKECVQRVLGDLRNLQEIFFSLVAVCRGVLKLSTDLFSSLWACCWSSVSASGSSKLQAHWSLNLYFKRREKKKIL